MSEVAVAAAVGPSLGRMGHSLNAADPLTVDALNESDVHDTDE